MPLPAPRSPAPPVCCDIAGRAASAVVPPPAPTELTGHGLGGPTAAAHGSAAAGRAERAGKVARRETEAEPGKGHSAGYLEAVDTAANVRMNKIVSIDVKYIFVSV